MNRTETLAYINGHLFGFADFMDWNDIWICMN
jgi:hypothetical protein